MTENGDPQSMGTRQELYEDLVAFFLDRSEVGDHEANDEVIEQMIVGMRARDARKSP